MKEKVNKYREIRKKVYEEATKPTPYDKNNHQTNKIKMKNTILNISSNANLNKYNVNEGGTIKLLWHQMWSKIFYANRVANVMTPFIDDIRGYFDNYENFMDAGWDDINSNLFQDYLNESGVFHGYRTYKDKDRIKKIVRIARKLNDHIQNEPNDVFSFVTGSNDDVWHIHKHLLNIGYTGNLTALHFMMDIGFPVIKPDVVISKLFLYLGWLHEIIPDLPKDLTYDDIAPPKGYQSKYGSKYVYTNSRMYKPIIDLAREIVKNTSQEDLKSDIGWISNNPLREFDLFMVKSGQKPESGFGIVRQLYSLTNTSNSCSTSCPLKK